MERCAILFNIGTIYSLQASKQNLSSDEGLKTANVLFKFAAGAFNNLKHLLETTTHKNYTQDLTISCSNMFLNLMLGQAQECFYSKAVKGNMKPKVVSMLAAQTAEFYETCVELAKANEIKGLISSKWITQLTIKKDLLVAMSNYHTSKEDFENGKYGISVARLQLANQLLTKHNKDIKQANNDFQELYQKSLKDIETELKKVVQENDTIYFDKVPSSESLPALPKKSMVSPSELDPSLTKLGPTSDPFVKLVPFAVHENLNQYNEQKKKFVSNELLLFEQASETLKVELQKMGLPGSLEALEKPKEGVLPPSLQEKVRVIQQEGGEKLIIEYLGAKASLANQNSKIIQDIIVILDNEENEDNEMKKRFGTKWNRTPSHTLTNAHRQEVAKFQANLQHALKSDSIVENRFKGIQIELRKMGGSLQEISTLLPQTQKTSNNSSDQKFIPELQKCMKAIEGILNARMQLQENLKTIAKNDNITNVLLESQLPPESIFEQELKKYSQIQGSIRDNIEKQRQQIEITKKLNNAWAQTKGNDQSQNLREQALQRLDQVYQEYLQLKANLREGIEFYTNIQESITKFKRRCEDFAFARQTEKQELIMLLSGNNSGNNQNQPQPPSNNPNDNQVNKNLISHIILKSLFLKKMQFLQQQQLLNQQQQLMNQQLMSQNLYQMQNQYPNPQQKNMNQYPQNPQYGGMQPPNMIPYNPQNPQNPQYGGMQPPNMNQYQNPQNPQYGGNMQPYPGQFNYGNYK